MKAVMNVEAAGLVVHTRTLNGNTLRADMELFLGWRKGFTECDP